MVSVFSRTFSRLPRLLSTSSAASESWRRNLQGEPWLSGPRDESWWTSLKPSDAGVPSVGADGCVRALPQLALDALTREKLQAYLDNTWLVDDSLFAALNGEEAFLSPPYHGLRRPQIFYYGHAAAFYVNKLVEGGVIEEAERVHPQFERLFELGVDEHPTDDMQRNVSPWPKVSEVQRFRRDVHALVSRVVERKGAAQERAHSKTVDSSHPLWALIMGMEHQRVHVETSSVLFREMAPHLLQPSTHFVPPHPTARRSCRTHSPQAGVDFPAIRLLQHAGGHAELGRRAAEPQFGWDLEYGTSSRLVRSFETDAHKASNGLFAGFVEAGGYGERRFWNDEGWAWRSSTGAQMPTFWKTAASETALGTSRSSTSPLQAPAAPSSLGLRLMSGSQIEMQWDWPAVVNRHEALALCAWLSEREGSLGAGAYRPASESELALLRAQNGRAAAETGRGGEADGDGLGEANLELTWSSEAPVHAMRPALSGHHDLRGNVWEHCIDAAQGLEPYKPHALYPEYSEPAFDGRHFMLVGGSFATHGAFASALTRNYFRPHFFQHAGFRLTRSL